MFNLQAFVHTLAKEGIHSDFKLLSKLHRGQLTRRYAAKNKVNKARNQTCIGLALKHITNVSFTRFHSIIVNFSSFFKVYLALICVFVCRRYAVVI